MVQGLVCFANLSAGLTNYGTMPLPMFLAQDYVTLKKRWREGFVASLAHIGIWSMAGFAWWKLLGIR
jgi:divalent anion:Na+ symporter, DASS family